MELSNLNINLSEIQKAISFEKSDKDLLKNHINELKTENNQLQSRLDALLKDFKYKIQKTNELYDSKLQQYTDEKNNYKEVLEKEFKQKMKSLDDKSKKHIDDLENLIDSQRSEAKNLKDKSDKVQSELNLCTETSAKKERELECAQKEFSAREKELKATHRRELNEKETKVQ